MLNKSLYCVIGAVIALALCANPVMASIAEDDFDDNSQNTTLWLLQNSENGVVEETDERLEYTSTAAPSDENAARYGLDMDLAYNSTWTSTIKVHVDDYALTASDHNYSIEMAVNSPCTVSGGNNEGVFLGLERGRDDNDVDFLKWAIYNEYGNDLGTSDSQGADKIDGSLKLEWNVGGNHLFKAYFKEDGDTTWTELMPGGFDLDDWDWDTSIAVEDRYLRLGIGGYDEGTGQALTDGDKLYLDDFVLTPEPATLTLTVLGAIALLRRKRRA